MPPSKRKAKGKAAVVAAELTATDVTANLVARCDRAALERLVISSWSTGTPVSLSQIEHASSEGMGANHQTSE